VLPDRYPLPRELEWYVRGEQRFGRLLDLGVILPRLPVLFAWSAAELSMPELATLLQGCVPTYAWDTGDDGPWNPPPGLGVRTARRLLPPRGLDG
jgi:hypothetical protein